MKLLDDLRLSETESKEVLEEFKKRTEEIDDEEIKKSVLVTILVENGLQEQAKVIQNLGMSSSEISEMIKETDPCDANEEAGNHLMEEYYLRLIPKEAFEVVKSNKVFFHHFKKFSTHSHAASVDLTSLLAEKPKMNGTTLREPKTMEEAFNSVSNKAEKTCDYSDRLFFPSFNTILAPFVAGRRFKEVRKQMEILLADLSNKNVVLGIDLGVPDDLKDEKPPETVKSVYKDFKDSSRMILEAVSRVLLDKDASGRPFYSPEVIVNVHDLNENFSPLMELAASQGIISFAKGRKFIDGTDLENMNTRVLQKVDLNLPRIAYDSKGDKEKFFSEVDSVLETVKRTLQIKKSVMDEKAENEFFDVGFIGLNEAVKALRGSELHEDEQSIDLARSLLEHCSGIVSSFGEDWRMVSGDFSTEMAEKDVEALGWDRVTALGSEDSPYYTSPELINLGAEIPLFERIRLEEKVSDGLTGGKVSVFLSEEKPSASDLAGKLKDFFLNEGAEFVNISFDHSYCRGCGKLYLGSKDKCTNCGSSEEVSNHFRVGNTYREGKEVREIRKYRV